MTEQSNATSSSTRIRDNQRRSRLRRAELVQTLQNRVQDYERQGVAATLEMQRAARKVAQENLRLRVLLARHGVLNEQIELYLRSPEESSISEANVLSFEKLPPSYNHRVSEKEGEFLSTHGQSPLQIQGRHEAPVHARVHSYQSPDDATEDYPPAPESSRTCAYTAQNRVPSHETTQSHYEASDSDFPCSIVGPTDCPSSLDCYCAPPSASEYRPPTSSGLKISCEAATAVIAEMRGDADRDSIRASLGCRDQGSCTVKNSTVFQIMDER